MFSVGVSFESGNICTCKNNNHICLFHCINTCRVSWENTWPDGLVFKQPPWDLTNVKAGNNSIMFDPYISR